MEKREKANLQSWMLFPLILTAIIYLGTTTNRGVTDYDEAYYVQPAIRMATTGDWVTPYANGVRFLEKPPLLYWITALSFKVLGICEFAMRLPTALAMIALVGVVMLMARHFGNETAVWIAGLSTALSVGSYLFTRETLHDVWLVFFLTVAMYALLEWRLNPERPLKPALLFYAAMAGGVMCKSLVGMAFPVCIAGIFFLTTRERPSWKTLHVIPGVLLFLMLTVPWHWLAEIRNPGFLDFFFIKEQFLRFMGRREPPVLWTVPLGTFWALIPVWFFPWTVFLPAAFFADRRAGDPKARIVLRLALAWAVVVLVFFSLSDRLEHYVFPALPALSLVAAAAFGREESGKAVLWGYRALAMIGVAVLGAGIFLGIWLASGKGPFPASGGPSNRLAETDFSIIAEMPREVVMRLIQPGIITISAVFACFLLALWLATRQKRRHAVVCLAVVMALVCAMSHWSLVICEDLVSSKKFGIVLGRQVRPGDRVVVAEDYETANSLNFYQPLPVNVADGTAYALIPGLKYPDAPKIILTRDEFQEAWESADRVFVLLPTAKRETLRPEGTEVMRLLHRVLVRNH